MWLVIFEILINACSLSLQHVVLFGLMHYLVHISSVYLGKPFFRIDKNAKKTFIKLTRIIVTEIFRYAISGGYDMEEKAARAYDCAALKYWGVSTHINFHV